MENEKQASITDYYEGFRKLLNNANPARALPRLVGEIASELVAYPDMREGVMGTIGLHNSNLERLKQEAEVAEEKFENAQTALGRLSDVRDEHLQAYRELEADARQKRLKYENSKKNASGANGYLDEVNEKRIERQENIEKKMHNQPHNPSHWLYGDPDYAPRASTPEFDSPFSQASLKAEQDASARRGLALFQGFVGRGRQNSI